MANSADLYQLASSEANWSGSTLFVKAGHIRVNSHEKKNKKKLKMSPVADVIST